MRAARAGVAAAVSLLAAACSDGVGAPSEAETLDQFSRDRTGFEAVIRTVTAEPRILRIERRPDGEFSIIPSNADPDRVASVASFMERHRIRYISTDRSVEPAVDFTTFEHFGRARYESRMLTHRPASPPSRLVASVDQEILSDPAADHTVFRSLGDGWYIRASSVPARD